MKLFITFLFFFVGYSATEAQTTFNRRYSLGYAHSIFNYVYATDSCYYVAGLVDDSLTGLNRLFFAKMDFQGDTISTKTLFTPIPRTNYDFWFGRLSVTTDNHFLLSGYGGDIHSSFSMITKLKENGDTLWLKKYGNPRHPNSFAFIVNSDVMEIPNGNILFASTIFDSTAWTGYVWYQRLDSMGNNISSTYYNNTNTWGEYYGKFYTDKYNPNLYLFSSIETNVTTSFRPLQSHNILRSIVPSGGVVWTYVHPEYCGTPNDVIRTLDTGYVIATSKVYNLDPSTPSFSPYVYKLNKNRQLLWSRELHGYGSYVLSQTDRVFEQPDSSIIAIGTNFISWDTVNYRNFNVCIIQKLSAAGDSLWGRQLYLLNQHAQDNLVRDARQTADGGFIICGETGGGLWVNEPQRGWLLKVDSMGCLTPGCHLLAAEAIATAEPQIQIYPNPAQDEAHVFMSLPRESTGYLVLRDGLGRELRRQPFAGQEATFVLDISGYASGLYFVSIEVAGALPVVRQLVKM